MSEPSAVAVIREALWGVIPRAGAKHRANEILAALEAAGFVVATREQIRAMSPSEQAELIGGAVEREWAEEDPDKLLARGTGPWREVKL